ncbi:MAG: YwaF family protein [Clostridia bacterium]|nr:YwaF family protein [Clostridia bacterium]
MVKLFNFWYLFFIVLGAGIIVGLYYLLRNKKYITKKIVLFSLLFFNLALHFLKLTFPPYSENPSHAMREIWFINLCATSVLFFPFLFLSKNKTAKDYMFYIGVLSGFLALLYPTEALGKSVLTLDLWRFYICHIIIIAVPLLTVMLGLHRLDVKRIYKVPFCLMAVLLFIICNQVLQSELGIIALRDGDIFNINWHNPSLIWGPTDDVAVLFSWLTPDFMKVIPFGEFAGQEKFWPFFWMVPGVFFYFLLEPLILCLIFDFKNTVSTFKNGYHYVINLFKKKKDAE